MLGNPIDVGRSTDGAYQAWFVNAQNEKTVSIFIKSASAFFIVPAFAGDSEGYRREYDNEWDQNYYSDRWLVRHFATLGRPVPRGLYPPWGGMAHFFLDTRDLDGWIKRVGWRKEDCTLPKNYVHWQQFDHGWIIGPVIHNKWQPDVREWVFVKGDTGHTSSYPVAVDSGTTCEDFDHH